MVSNHKLEILGNQTKAKNIHHFGAEKAAYSYSSWNNNNKKTNPKHIPVVARKKRDCFTRP